MTIIKIIKKSIPIKNKKHHYCDARAQKAMQNVWLFINNNFQCQNGIMCKNKIMTQQIIVNDKIKNKN